jgi:hypothetical protein
MIVNTNGIPIPINRNTPLPYPKLSFQWFSGICRNIYE